MAYISQYEADMARQQNADKGLDLVLAGIQGLEENRKRALQAEKDKELYEKQLSNADTDRQIKSYGLEQLKKPLEERDDYRTAMAKEALYAQRLGAQEAGKVRAEDRANQTRIEAEKRAQEAKVSEEKRKKEGEFNNRYQNILGEAEQLKDLINKKGTYELSGSHNNDLAMKIDSVAIDAAKLFDPESVARESEVAAFRKMLFEPGSLTTKNSTAIDTVNSFKSMIEDRAKRMRGEVVPADQAVPPQTSIEQQKALRLQQLRAKKAGFAMGGQ